LSGGDSKNTTSGAFQFDGIDSGLSPGSGCNGRRSGRGSPGGSVYSHDTRGGVSHAGGWGKRKDYRRLRMEEHQRSGGKKDQEEEAPRNGEESQKGYIG